MPSVDSDDKTPFDVFPNDLRRIRERPPHPEVSRRRRCPEDVPHNATKKEAERSCKLIIIIEEHGRVFVSDSARVLEPLPRCIYSRP